MRLSILGSGSAFSECGCNAAHVIDNRLLIDCGAPVQVMLTRLGTDATQLRAVILSHFHADHTFMLPMLLGRYCLTADPGPPGLIIAGPVGTREYVARIVSDGFGVRLQRMMDDAAQIRYVALQDGSDVDVAGYRVRAHAVVHSTGPSLAYAVTDDAGTTVGFSGDSSLCAGLRRCIAQSDCFVCECTSWDHPDPHGHLWAGEVAQLIGENPSTRFVLSHMPERRELRGAIIAHDLLTLDVTPR